MGNELARRLFPKCTGIRIGAFGFSLILDYVASRLGYVGLPPKPAWGFHPQTPSPLRAYERSLLNILPLLLIKKELPQQFLFFTLLFNQPLTAPATTPSMIYFWHTRYITMIGITVIMIHAIIGPISTRP